MASLARWAGCFGCAAGGFGLLVHGTFLLILTLAEDYGYYSMLSVKLEFNIYSYPRSTEKRDEVQFRTTWRGLNEVASHAAGQRPAIGRRVRDIEV